MTCRNGLGRINICVPVPSKFLHETLSPIMTALWVWGLWVESLGCVCERDVSSGLYRADREKIAFSSHPQVLPLPQEQTKGWPHQLTFSSSQSPGWNIEICLSSKGDFVTQPELIQIPILIPVGFGASVFLPPTTSSHAFLPYLQAETAFRKPSASSGCGLNHWNLKIMEKCHKFFPSFPTSHYWVCFLSSQGKDVPFLRCHLLRDGL